MADPAGKDQVFIAKLSATILANLGDENFGVEELAHKSAISRYTLNRRLSAINGKTINQFIRETRLQKALEMLQNEEVTASEVSYKVGFSSATYFNTCFHEFFGYPPGQVKKINSDNRKEIDSARITVKQKQKKIVRWTFITMSGIVLLSVLVYLGYNIFLRNSSTRAGPSGKDLEKSIAVLPFKNLSDTLSNQYFIDGLMEEILTDLSRMHELRVIARTSVEQFRESKRSVSQIAKKLNVNYIVEGSGQKYGNKFVLRVQLITADRERHLWAESYKQEISEANDIFTIQSQIAQKIAAELKINITAQEEDLIQQIPTNSSLAYDYYLRGKKYNSDLKLDSAIVMFGKAVEQDPEFVLAHLARAYLYSILYFTKGDYITYWGDWKDFDGHAKEDLEISLKISPNSPEVKLEQADQLFRLDLNYDKALALLDEINDQMTNNPLFFFLRSFIIRRKGQWEESMKEVKKAILLDPLNADYYIQMGMTYYLTRRYPEAIEFYDKPRLLGLNYVPKDMKFYTILLWKGDLEEAQKISGLSISQLGAMIDLEFNYFYFSRQFEKLIPIANKFEDEFRYFPKTLILSKLYFLDANISLSRKYADSAIAELNLKVKESPQDERYYSALGYAYAFKGEKREAIENAQKAVKLRPLELDAWAGYWKELDLAKIYVLTGEYDLAMNIIERLLTIPGEFSVPILKIDPAYDKLRSLPRFQKILTTEYETRF
jgi:TolB-like protein/AraC-like DNA-binding protein/Flp pilus assembly protein TadD